jgi:hypothetical protein
MSTYLHNEMRGWEADMAKQRDLASALAIVLVLLATIQYTGMLTPPLGYVSLSTANNTTEPVLTSQKDAVLAFVIFNSIGFALSTVALLAVLATTMIPSLRGAVYKAVETFCAYVTDASEENFAHEQDPSQVSITYRRAIANNFRDTIMGDIMRLRLGSLEELRKRPIVEHLGLFLDDAGLQLPSLPSSKAGSSATSSQVSVATAPMVYWRVFTAVYEFFLLCLPYEHMKHRVLVRFSTACLAASLVCTGAAFTSGLCSYSTSLGKGTAAAAWGTLPVALVLSVTALTLRMKRANVFGTSPGQSQQRPIPIVDELRVLSEVPAAVQLTIYHELLPRPNSSNHEHQGGVAVRYRP